MFLRLPSKKLTSTRLPGSVPGTSSNTKHGALSVCVGHLGHHADVLLPGEPLDVLHLAELLGLVEPFAQVVIGEMRRGVGADAGRAPFAAAPLPPPERRRHAVRLTVLLRHAVLPRP